MNILRKKTTATLMIAIFMISAFAVLAVSAEEPSFGTPVQLTSSVYYERGESIVYDGSYYWLFYGRATDETGTYASGYPDPATYKLYYKVATTIESLVGATPNKVSDDIIYQGQTSCVFYTNEVWVFVTVGGAIKAWKTDGDAPFAPADSIGVTGASHQWSITYGDKIFLAYAQGGDIDVKTYDDVVWSGATVDVSTNDFPRFFEDSDGKLHLYSVEWGSGFIGIYTYTGTSWPVEPTVSIPNTIPKNCDPALFQLGDGDFCLLNAPCYDVYQYIEGRTAVTLAGLATATTFSVTTGGSNNWVDMWPVHINDGNYDYILFTSEMADLLTKGTTGNIWYMIVNWEDSSFVSMTYTEELPTAPTISISVTPTSIDFSDTEPDVLTIENTGDVTVLVTADLTGVSKDFYIVRLSATDSLGSYDPFPGTWSTTLTELETKSLTLTLNTAGALPGTYEAVLVFWAEEA